MHPDGSSRKTPALPSGAVGDAGLPPAPAAGAAAGSAAGSGLGFAAAVAANVTLALGPVFVRAADTGPVASAFWRITLAAPMLAVLAVLGGLRPARLAGTPWLLLALAGIAFAADLGTWYMGILRTTLANATLFGNCATLIFPVYGFLVARAWPTRMQGFALLLAAVGGGLLLGRSYQLDPRNFVGDMLSLLAGLLYTVYFVLMARVGARLAPLTAVALSTCASIVPLFLFATAHGDRLWPGDWTPLIAMAVVCQVVGQGCMIFALARLTPLVIGIALLIQPMVAGAIGWIVYGETLAAPDFVGVALVAAALVLVRREPRRLASALVDADVEPSRRPS